MCDSAKEAQTKCSNLRKLGFKAHVEKFKTAEIKARWVEVSKSVTVKI